MAIIACPECTSEVSDKAPSCPKCGTPIAAAAEVRAVGTAVVTTQGTSKRLKMHKMIALAMVIVGFLLIMTTRKDITCNVCQRMFKPR